MLPPLEVQMTACLQRLRTGALPVSELEALFDRIRADVPAFAPPGRQVRHLVDISVKLLGEAAPEAFCRLATRRHRTPVCAV